MAPTSINPYSYKFITDSKKLLWSSGNLKQCPCKVGTNIAPKQIETQRGDAMYFWNCPGNEDHKISVVAKSKCGFSLKSSIERILKDFYPHISYATYLARIAKLKEDDEGEPIPDGDEEEEDLPRRNVKKRTRVEEEEEEEEEEAPKRNIKKRTKVEEEEEPRKKGVTLASIKQGGAQSIDALIKELREFKAVQEKHMKKTQKQLQIINSTLYQTTIGLNVLVSYNTSLQLPKAPKKIKTKEHIINVEDEEEQMEQEPLHQNLIADDDDEELNSCFDKVFPDIKKKKNLKNKD